MNLLLLLLLSQTQAPEASPLLDRPVRTRDMMRAGGRSGVGPPFFEFAPASGAGMGTECACAAVTGAKGGALTFTRASVAECYSNDGQTLTQCASGQPRVSSGTASSSWLGLWVEDVATNLILQSRDLSQAAWTKTNMTCALTATGMRGVANSASTCTAAAPNATVCQTVTTAAATRTSSWHLKKGTLTGALTLARDGATYGADISSQVSASVWRRAVPMDTAGCAGGNCIVQAALTGSVLNPQVCLKLANTGDSVLIDFVQDEAGDIATTPILTTAASATRAQEVASITHAALQIGSMSAVVQTMGVANGGGTPIVDYLDASHLTYIQTPINSGYRYGVCNWYNGAASQVNSYWNTPISASTPTPVGCTFGTGAGAENFYMRGAPGNSAVAGTTQPSTTTLYLGSTWAPGAYQYGVIKGVRLDPGPSRGLWSGQPTSTQGGIAWVGDSITAGQGAPTAIPGFLLGSSITKAVQPFGIPGNTASQCLANWRTNVSGKGYATLVVLCGVNDLAADATAATIYSTLSTIYTEALAQGMKVVAVNMTPWANAATWNAGRQTQTDSLKALISGTGGGVVVVSTDSLGTGSPLALTGGNDSGDHLHPSAAGNAALATLVQAANP